MIKDTIYGAVVILIFITLGVLYNRVQNLDVDRSNCKPEITRIKIKLYDYELKLDRMHQILKMKTYNNLLNQRRKIK